MTILKNPFTWWLTKTVPRKLKAMFTRECQDGLWVPGHPVTYSHTRPDWNGDLVEVYWCGKCFKHLLTFKYKQDERNKK